LATPDPEPIFSAALLFHKLSGSFSLPAIPDQARQACGLPADQAFLIQVLHAPSQVISRQAGKPAAATFLTLYDFY
jgi:hypothetical protein